MIGTITDVRSQGVVLFKCIAGSKAYGLSTETSDTDIRGVFAVPAKHFFGLQTAEQVNGDNNNIVYFELKRFVELLAKNNPNVIELLGIEKQFVLARHPLFELLKPELFLSKRCFETFGRYAHSQVKKAQGLNKKILNPMPEERKTVLDFCYVLHGYGSRPLREWLREKAYLPEQCGLVRVPHFRDTYAVFYDDTGSLAFRGIVAKDTSDDVATSAVPDTLQPIAVLSFNRDAYSRYCRDYTSYQTWIKERNEERYRSTLTSGKNYDAKNMMHVFRLLDTARDIARYGEIRTWRENRDELFAIRNGSFSYQELVEQVEIRVAELEELFANSSLPDIPDEQAIEDILVAIRMELYGFTN